MIGEKWLGNAKDCDPIIYLSIGTGLGSAILANGKIIQGSQHMAGEIGSWLDKADFLDGKRNIFGELGISDLKVSGTALENKYESSEKLFEDYQRGIEKACQVMDEFLMNLCILLSNVASFLNPKKIILGGGVSEAMTSLLPMIQNRVDEITTIPVIIENSSLGNAAAAIGAATIVFQKFQGE